MRQELKLMITDFISVNHYLAHRAFMKGKTPMVSCYKTQKAKEFQIPIISCMGTGNKLDPSCFQITDISKTSVCPLAKVMRTELKKRKIKKVKVLFSTEISPGEKRKRLGIKEETVELEEKRAATGRPVPGSVSFVPGAAGLMIAGQVVRDLVNL